MSPSSRARPRRRCRRALALIRIVQDRAAQARDLLVGLDDGAWSGHARSNVFAVRALAEVRLGDVAQSRRLIQAARRIDGDVSALLPLAEAALKQAEAQRAAQA